MTIWRVFGCKSAGDDEIVGQKVWFLLEIIGNDTKIQKGK